MTARTGSYATWLLLAVFGGGCGHSAAESAASRLEVFVGIAPLAYLVERVGGEHVVVHVLLQPGQNEHTFSLTPKQTLALGKAKLFVQAGLPFENQLGERIRQSHPQLVVVPADRGIPKRIASEECCHEADHDHEHAAGEPDPHIWLSPPLLKIMAANIAESLVRADPGQAGQYRKNLAALLGEIDSAQARISSLLKPHRGQAFYVFHPAFGYFADAYGLRQEAVEAGGKVPTPRQLLALIKRGKADGVKIIFIQPQFDQRSAQVVAAAIGGAVLPIDPLAKDVLSNLQNVAANIAAAL
jgi:zinc transport system substrate-binding protein